MVKSIPVKNSRETKGITFKMSHAKKYLSGIMLSGGIAAVAYIISFILPAGILGETLIALLLGMLLNPLVCRYTVFDPGMNWTSKKIGDTSLLKVDI